MTVHTLQGSGPTADVTEIELDLEAGWLLAWASMLGGSGVGVAPGVSEFAGTSVTEDNGFLGWREHLPVFSPPVLDSVVDVPLIVRVDAGQADAETIPLASPKFAPDTVAGLLMTGVAVSAVVAALHFGFRQMRVREMGRGHQESGSSS